MTLEVHSPDATHVRIICAMGNNAGNFQFKTHPKISKQLWTQSSTLGLGDPTKPFPTGSALGVLKWRFLTTEDSHAPLLLTCVS